MDGTTTFAYHEEGLTEFIGSPAGHQATMSSTSIEREDIPKARATNPPRATSAIGESASEAASVSVSTNTHRWVDNLVGSESANHDAPKEGLQSEFADRIPPTPPGHSFGDSPVKEAGNDTSYGLIGTSTARELVRDLRSHSPQSQQQSTPRPILPSILNSPFAPQAGEESPHSRPSTAKRMTTHSQRTSQNGFPILPQPVEYSVDSSISSMQDPSGNVFRQTQNRPSQFGIIGPPSVLSGKRNVSAFDDSVFDSSSIFHGSSWEGPRPSMLEVINVQTPPNGQGGG